MRLTFEQIEQRYGVEFPQSITLNGVRMPLVKEGRFLRYYHNDEVKRSAEVSKYIDGSVDITFKKIEWEWAYWSHEQRIEFCNAGAWLKRQSHLPDIIGHLIKNCEKGFWQEFVFLVAKFLPNKEDGFEVFINTLEKADEIDSPNIIQQIALTKHAKAPAIIFNYLEKIWVNQKLWDNDKSFNQLACAAVNCIKYLIALGLPPQNFEDRVRLLADHPCKFNRDNCSSWLYEYYEWLPKPKPFNSGELF